MLVVALTTSIAVCASRSARAGEWVYESEDADVRAGARLRFSSRFSFWIGTFHRPPRACGFAIPGVAGTPGFYTAQAGLVGCAADSDEVALGPGVEAAFRVAGPFYLTAGIDFLYSAPESSSIDSQLVIPVGFGALFTWYPWALRPIARAHITPILYLGDDARDYTVGIDGGFAGRILDWGDLSVMLGYQTAETVESWQIQIGLHPIPH